jgi:hypothetical protein
MHHITLAHTAQKTPLPRIAILSSDVLSGLLPSNGPRIADAGACLGGRGNVFNGRCLAMDDFSRTVNLAFSRHVITDNYINCKFNIRG